jgi:hypothetical protein
MSRFTIYLFLTAVALLLAGCNQSAPDTQETITRVAPEKATTTVNEALFTAVEYSFSGPERLPAG